MNVVGTETAVSNVEKVLGNSIKRLNEPNLITIFVGIALGIVLGSIPISFPGIPQPVKLGLAGGPLVVAILISRFGYHYKLITYTTQSANLMLREIGITLFLACVGISAGDGFVDTIVNNGGFAWIGYGFIITFCLLYTSVKSSEHLFQFSLSTDKTYPGYWDMQSSVSHLNLSLIHILPFSSRMMVVGPCSPG